MTPHPSDATFGETGNLSDLDLLERDYDRLEELSEIRQKAIAAGYTGLLVRWAFARDGRAGYVYGLAVAGDFPHWRGTLDAVRELVRDRERR